MTIISTLKSVEFSRKNVSLSFEGICGCLALSMIFALNCQFFEQHNSLTETASFFAIFLVESNTPFHLLWQFSAVIQTTISCCCCCCRRCCFYHCRCCCCCSCCFWRLLLGSFLLLLLLLRSL